MKMLHAYARTRTSLSVLAALFALGCSDDSSTSTVVTGPASSNGTLRIEIVGLSAGSVANVSVQGPNGTSQAVTSAADLSLASGTYAVTTANATGTTSYPVLPTQSVSVSAGQVTTLRVRYAPMPVSGTAVPSLVAFDDSVIAFMRARSIPAGEIEVYRGGQTVLSRAYGWKDAAKTTPFAAGSPMRVASLTKAVTMAAIHQLVAAGKLTYSTPAFDFLGITSLPVGAAPDSRLASVTVQMLLDHKGGFGPPGSVPDSRAVSVALGLSRPPTTTEVARYVMGRPLMYTPGGTYAYSNVGFLILGLIVEKASQQDFISYVKQNHFDAGFAPDIQLARTRPADRDAREPWYSDPNSSCSVFVITSCSVIASPDGGFFFEDFHAYGGLVVTPATYVRFMTKFWGDGRPRAGGAQNWFWFGSINGTFSLARWRGDGTLIVAFFNQRTDPSGLAYENIQVMLDGAAALITQWP